MNKVLFLLFGFLLTFSALPSLSSAKILDDTSNDTTGALERFFDEENIILTQVNEKPIKAYITQIEIFQKSDSASDRIDSLAKIKRTYEFDLVKKEYRILDSISYDLSNNPIGSDATTSKYMPIKPDSAEEGVLSFILNAHYQWIDIETTPQTKVSLLKS